jgi:hypothetical protein
MCSVVGVMQAGVTKYQCTVMFRLFRKRVPCGHSYFFLNRRCEVICEVVCEVVCKIEGEGECGM